jgi:hypothetical protein
MYHFINYKQLIINQFQGTTPEQDHPARFYNILREYYKWT